MNIANTIRSTIGLGADGRLEPPSDQVAEKRAARVREARLEVARRAGWTELAEAALVARGPRGWLIDAPSDTIFTVRRGETFAPGTASLISGAGLDLYYFVTIEGNVVILEKLSRPARWSDVVERQARRKVATR